MTKVVKTNNNSLQIQSEKKGQKCTSRFCFIVCVCVICSSSFRLLSIQSLKPNVNNYAKIATKAEHKKKKTTQQKLKHTLRYGREREKAQKSENKSS